MRRIEQAQGLRPMKFQEVYGRTVRGKLSQAEAAEVLGMSERTFRRWRDRFEAGAQRVFTTAAWAGFRPGARFGTSASS